MSVPCPNSPPVQKWQNPPPLPGPHNKSRRPPSPTRPPSPKVGKKNLEPPPRPPQQPQKGGRFGMARLQQLLELPQVSAHLRQARLRRARQEKLGQGYLKASVPPSLGKPVAKTQGCQTVELPGPIQVDKHRDTTRVFSFAPRRRPKAQQIRACS